VDAVVAAVALSASDPEPLTENDENKDGSDEIKMLPVKDLGRTKDEGGVS
jgi:hypothetical protein